MAIQERLPWSSSGVQRKQLIVWKQANLLFRKVSYLQICHSQSQYREDKNIARTVTHLWSIWGPSSRPFSLLHLPMMHTGIGYESRFNQNFLQICYIWPYTQSLERGAMNEDDGWEPKAISGSATLALPRPHDLT